MIPRKLLAAVLLLLLSALFSSCKVVQVPPGPGAIDRGITQAASSGEQGLVVLEDGQYGDQVVTKTNPKGTLVVPQHPQGARMTTLDVKADRITFNDLTADAENVDARGALYISGDYVTLQNSRVRNVLNEKNIVSGDHVTIDRNLFSHVWMDDAGHARDVHQECIYAIWVPYGRFTNNTFRDCGVMDLFFTYGTWWEPRAPAYGNVTVTGNDFGCPRFENNQGCHYYALYFGSFGPEAGQGNFAGSVVRDNRYESAGCVSNFAVPAGIEC